MGAFRFRRTIKIAPGVRLNISKTGVSTSVGVRGANVTFGRRGTTSTVGIPGSGLSYSSTKPPREPNASASHLKQVLWVLLAVVAVMIIVAIAQVAAGR